MLQVLLLIQSDQQYCPLFTINQGFSESLGNSLDVKRFMTSATMQRVQTLQSIDAPYLHVFTNPANYGITILKYY